MHQLERAIGGAVLALMLALAVLTFGVPTRATANAPIIVMEQRSPQRVSVPPPEQPPAAEPTPALVVPLAIQPDPTAEPPTPVVVVAVESPPPAAPAPVVESQLIYEADGSVTLPGVDDWYTPPPPPEPTAVPVVSAPPINYCPRCGWRPPRAP